MHIKDKPDCLTTSVALPLLGAALLGPALQISHAQQLPHLQVRSQMLVTTAWLEQHLGDQDLIVLQIGRDRTQFDAGHIPGARFVRLDEIVEQHTDSLNELPPVPDLRDTFEHLGIGNRTRVVLVDDSGGVLAARAYFTLDYLGHGEQAALLNGGVTAWIGESRPLSKEQPTLRHATFVPRIRREMVISTGQMARLSAAVSTGSRQYSLLDARPVAEHTGVVYSESVSQPGHIAGSQSLYWKELINSGANGHLLPDDELRRRFMDAGAAPGKRVITYCRTGMQSSFTYFVARYLGYDAAMYDGSVYEWVRSSGFRLVLSQPDHSLATRH